jgi:hypothetical protein
VLSEALKIADKITVATEGVGNKIRLNSQGCPRCAFDAVSELTASDGNLCVIL